MLRSTRTITKDGLKSAASTYFRKAFGNLVRIIEEARADVLGDHFQGSITYCEAGQYFTPEPICDLMAQMTGTDEGKTVP